MNGTVMRLTFWAVLHSTVLTLCSHCLCVFVNRLFPSQVIYLREDHINKLVPITVKHGVDSMAWIPDFVPQRQSNYSATAQ